MRSRYRINEPDCAHFITSTVVAWLPVFTTQACCDILVRSLEHCRTHKALQVHAWVILDNHFHAIVSGPKLAQTIRDWKRFTAGAILKQIAEEHREWLLNQLAFQCAAHKTGSDHQVWQEGVHPQAILSDAIMEQKLDYVHNNPVQRGLVASAEHWRYSSAHEWLEGASPVMRCDRGDRPVAGPQSTPSVPDGILLLPLSCPNSIWARAEEQDSIWHGGGALRAAPSFIGG